LTIDDRNYDEGEIIYVKINGTAARLKTATIRSSNGTNYDTITISSCYSLESSTSSVSTQTFIMLFKGSDHFEFMCWLETDPLAH